jgi:structure-specific endonuclease subunit SLX1
VDSESLISAHAPKARNQSQAKRDEGKTKPRHGRSMTSHLGNLHLLLRSVYFNRWPLKVHFFSQDVYHLWQAWSERVDGLLPDRIQVISNAMPFSALSGKHTGNNLKPTEIHQFDIDYGNLKEHLKKALFILGESTRIGCGICEQPVRAQDDLIVVCPWKDCRCVCHMACLSQSFLQGAGMPGQIIPMEGGCPGCKSTVQWASLMKELSLRTRGEKEIQDILKKDRRRSPNSTRRTACSKEAKIDCAIVPGAPHEYASVTSTVPEIHMRVGESLYRDKLFDYYAEDDEQLDVNWVEGVDLETDYDGSDLEKPRSKPAQSRMEIVIEDSDCDNAEV